MMADGSRSADMHRIAGQDFRKQAETASINAGTSNGGIGDFGADCLQRAITRF